MIKQQKKKAFLIVLFSSMILILAGCNKAEDNAGVNSGGNSSASKAQDDSSQQQPAVPASAAPAKTAAAAPAAAKNQIVIDNFTFKPAALTVKKGDTVTWVNRDDIPHTATENDKRFNSGTIDTDQQFSFTFAAPGTYAYFCALHPKMTGQVIVK